MSSVDQTIPYGAAATDRQTDTATVRHHPAEPWTVREADRAPPLAPQLQYPSNPVFFDLIGRSYRMGVRMKF